MNNEQMKKENKKIITLAIIIIVVIAIIGIILLFTDKGLIKSEEVTNSTIKDMLSKNEEKIIYVENSDEKKCEKCKEIKKHLKEEKISYMVYDVKEKTKKEYTEMLQMLSINPSDFNYPAILYIKNGIMYSNIINIDSDKTADQYIKDYELKKVK